PRHTLSFGLEKTEHHFSNWRADLRKFVPICDKTPQNLDIQLTHLRIIFSQLRNQHPRVDSQMEPRKDLLMKSLYAFALVLLLIAAGGLLDAQVVNGINGTVADTTGAVIPGAHVSATNTATGVKAEAITSSAGTFTIVGLNPGKYIVVVAAEKFKSVQTNVTVEVAKM